MNKDFTALSAYQLKQLRWLLHKDQVHNVGITKDGKLIISRYVAPKDVYFGQRPNHDILKTIVVHKEQPNFFNWMKQSEGDRDIIKSWDDETGVTEKNKDARGNPKPLTITLEPGDWYNNSNPNI